MEYASGLIKLKPGSEEKVEEWRKTIASRLDEAAATLKDEDVQVESWFTIVISGEKYLLWYLRARSIKRVFEVSRQLKHPIDRFHYDVMEAIPRRISLPCRSSICRGLDTRLLKVPRCRNIHTPYTQIYIALTDLYRPSVRRIIPSALG